MKLYDCHMTPNPRRARIFIAEKGVDIPKVEVNLIEGENLREPYLEINPRGLLPTLELDDGTRFDLGKGRPACRPCASTAFRGRIRARRCSSRRTSRCTRRSDRT